MCLAATRPSSAPRGLLFIVSAPSGTGKTTLVERLVQILPGLRMSRSYTSRPARPGEQDGVDYNFVARDRFLQMRDEGAALETAIRLSEKTPFADVDEARKALASL